MGYAARLIWGNLRTRIVLSKHNPSSGPFPQISLAA